MLGGGENDDGGEAAAGAARPDPDGEVYEPGTHGRLGVLGGRGGGDRPPPRGGGRSDTGGGGYEDFINFVGGGGRPDPGAGPGRDHAAADATSLAAGAARPGGRGPGPPHRLSSAGSASVASVTASDFGGSAGDLGPSVPSDRTASSHGASAASLPPRVSEIAVHRPRVLTREFTVNKHEHDAKGRCVRHPAVRLRKKRAFGRGWKVLIHRCPECCLDELRVVKAELSRSAGRLPPTPERGAGGGGAGFSPAGSLSSTPPPSDGGGGRSRRMSGLSGMSDDVDCGTMTWLTTDGDVLSGGGEGA